jgi:hypothetical protein
MQGTTSATKRWRRNGLLVLFAAILAGCAPLPPVPFELVDRNQTWQGTFYPSEQRLEAVVSGKTYRGFYIIASGTAYAQPMWPRRLFPNDTIVTFTSNAARATMSADDGERLFCEFNIEGGRAVGECKSPGGQSYQLVAQPR